MKRSVPHWIKHSHFFDPDEYECSACGHVFCTTSSRCPNCGAQLSYTHDTEAVSRTSNRFKVMYERVTGLR